MQLSFENIFAWVDLQCTYFLHLKNHEVCKSEFEMVHIKYTLNKKLSSLNIQYLVTCSKNAIVYNQGKIKILSA